jgi:hypothetical protein
MNHTQVRDKRIAMGSTAAPGLGVLNAHWLNPLTMLACLDCLIKKERDMP